MGRSRGGRRRRRGGGGGGRGGFRRNPLALLRGLIGSTLTGVEADLVERDGELDVDPSGLLLHFGEGNDISVVPSHDGESIRVSRRPLPPFPDDEPDLRVVRQVQTGEPQWQPFVGKKCEDVFEVRDTTFSSKGSWCGVELQFEDGVMLTAYSWDDELLTHATPEDTGFFERKSVKKEDDEGGDRDGRPKRSDGAKGDESTSKAKADGAEESAGSAESAEDSKEASGAETSEEKPKKRTRRRRKPRPSSEEE